MTPIKKNIAANFAGRFLMAVISIAFVPLYLRYVSVEIYGIIGFFASIQAFLSLLDGGISPTLNRETAALSAIPEKFQELRDLSRTLEVLCWVCGIAACLIGLMVAPAAAQYWLKSESISPVMLRDALYLMSISFAFQWAAGFYTGGLNGLQEQRILNVINVSCAVLRAFGCLWALAYVSPTLGAFLWVQLIVSVLNCILLRLLFWRSLPETDNKPSFNFQLLRRIWRYAAGMTGTGIATLILTQTDKIILSKMLTLEEFGYYSLAITLAGTSIGIIVSSIQSAYFPRFSSLVAQDNLLQLKQVYHQGCQVMSLFIVPLAAMLAFFAYEILLVWTRNPSVADNTYVLLALVAIGTGLNGLMHLPYFAQLAFGITRIGLWQSILTIIFLIPLMIFATLRFGAVGGAGCWALLNLAHTVIGLQYMHRYVLQGELRKWYLMDVGLPLIIAVVINGGAYIIFKNLGAEMVPIEALFLIGAVFLTTCLTTAFALPMIKNPLMKIVWRYG